MSSIGINSRIHSNLGHIGLFSSELLALERRKISPTDLQWRKRPGHSNFIFYQNLINLLVNRTGMTSQMSSKFRHIKQFVSELLIWHFPGFKFSNMQVSGTGI